MDWKTLASTFAAVFLAELGDKTQLATVLYAADRPGAKVVVFVGAASALVTTSAIGVAAGAAVATYVDPRVLTRLAGLGFIGLGMWTLARA